MDLKIECIIDEGDIKLKLNISRRRSRHEFQDMLLDWSWLLLKFKHYVFDHHCASDVAHNGHGKGGGGIGGGEGYLGGDEGSVRAEGNGMREIGMR